MLNNMGAGKSQEQRDQEIYTRANEILREQGYEPVTQSTTKVPEQFANDRITKAWFGALERMSPRMQEAKVAKLYSQKFAIGSRPAMSRYDRRNLSLISPDNPFDTQQGEGLQRVFGLIEKQADKIGLARGGKYHGDRMEHGGRKKFF